MTESNKMAQLKSLYRMEVVGEMNAGGLGRLVCDVGVMGCMSAMVFRRRRHHHRCAGGLQHTSDGLAEAH